MHSFTIAYDNCRVFVDAFLVEEVPFFPNLLRGFLFFVFLS
jgi:hypothetical protein